MSHYMIPSREEIGDPFAALERARKLRAKMYGYQPQRQVIPAINKQSDNPEKIEENKFPPVVRDIIQVASGDLQWPPVSKPKFVAATIINEVAQEYGLTPNDIKSHRQHAYVVEARFKVVWRLRNETPMSLPHIGRVVGGRDHTTILSALRRYQSLMSEGKHERQLRLYGRVKGDGPT